MFIQIGLLCIQVHGFVSNKLKGIFDDIIIIKGNFNKTLKN